MKIELTKAEITTILMQLTHSLWIDIPEQLKGQDLGALIAKLAKALEAAPISQHSEFGHEHPGA